MGAIICDTILQAGLNYRTVVAPRVNELIRRWPSAWRTSTFAAMTTRFGISKVLNWRDPEKPRRIIELTNLLSANHVDSESQLREWLSDSANTEPLRRVRGVGPKTADYIKALVGVEAVAVDRHVRTFVAWAGLSLARYDEVQQVVCDAADMLGHDRGALDHAIWTYVSAADARRAASAA
jgi:endonuclease III